MVTWDKEKTNNLSIFMELKRNIPKLSGNDKHTSDPDQ